MRRRAEAAVAELEEVGRERRLVARLDDARSRQATYKDSQLDNADRDPNRPVRIRHGYVDREAVAGAYAAAFREFGIDVLGLAEGEAAEQVRRRQRVRDQLAAALDDWAQFAPRETARRLRSVARAADPDPVRDKVRAAIQGGETVVLRTLAESPDGIALPPATIGDASVASPSRAFQRTAPVPASAQLRKPSSEFQNRSGPSRTGDEIIGTLTCPAVM